MAFMRESGQKFDCLMAGVHRGQPQRVAKQRDGTSRQQYLGSQPSPSVLPRLGPNRKTADVIHTSHVRSLEPRSFVSYTKYDKRPSCRTWYYANEAYMVCFTRPMTRRGLSLRCRPSGFHSLSRSLTSPRYRLTTKRLDMYVHTVKNRDRCSATCPLLMQMRANAR